jgi:hypothetical protein
MDLDVYRVQHRLRPTFGRAMPERALGKRRTAWHICIYVLPRFGLRKRKLIGRDAYDVTVTRM